MKRIIAAAVVFGLVALGACSSPTSPAQAKYNQGKTSSSRYMLASGASPAPGCTDNGNGTQTCPPGVYP